MRIRLCLTLRPETLALVKDLAEKEDLPLSRLVDRVLREYVEKENEKSQGS